MLGREMPVALNVNIVAAFPRVLTLFSASRHKKMLALHLCTAYHSAFSLTGFLIPITKVHEAPEPSLGPAHMASTFSFAPYELGTRPAARDS